MPAGSQSTGVCGQDSDSAVSFDLHGARITVDAEWKQRRQLIRPKNPNWAALKQKELKIFQTVNHAQIIWNPQTKPKGILGGHINIRSILPKIDQINRLLTDSNLDYLCVTESWLNPSTPTDLINIPGFKCYRRDRVQGRGGGCAIIH